MYRNVNIQNKKRFVVILTYLNGINSTEIFFVEICKYGQYLNNNKESFCTFLLFEFFGAPPRNKKLTVAHLSAAIKFISCCETIDAR